MPEQEKFFWFGIAIIISFIVGTFIITFVLYFANKREKEKRFSELIDEKFQDPNKGRYGFFEGCETTICNECKIKTRCCEEAMYFYYNPALV